jgi:hypothetical protein
MVTRFTEHDRKYRLASSMPRPVFLVGFILVPGRFDGARLGNSLLGTALERARKD